jgi:hypothetical protein
MLNVLDRYFTDQLYLNETHVLHVTIDIDPHISAAVYRDDPYYLTIFSVDGKPILKEVFVCGIHNYLRDLRCPNLHAFLTEYAK